eukprot:m.224559 g.224559  ORF g.224559 m.224559 type:complete len:66 (+) comp33435_c2_seq1:45-242(+)
MYVCIKHLGCVREWVGKVQNENVTTTTRVCTHVCEYVYVYTYVIVNCDVWRSKCRDAMYVCVFTR